MSARRVGFGESDEPPKGRPSAIDPAPEAATAEPAKEASRFARAFIALFLLVWLVFWTYGMVFAFTSLLSSYASGDIAGTLFLTVWLFFGGIGWLFAAGILLAILFGKKSDPNNPSPLRRRMMAKRARRKAERARAKG